jgi:ribosomal protein S27AE
MPYGYYVFLRWAVCVTCAYGAWVALRDNRTVWVWLLGAAALLFNPIVPIRMRREEWFVFDILGAGLLLAGAVALRNRINPDVVMAGGQNSDEDIVTCPRCGARNRVIRASRDRATCGRCHESLQ